jgi:leucyl aminopeptidase (aminopeptidase T)
MRKDELMSACRIALVECMGLQSGEKVAVITDEPCRNIGLALFDTARDLGNETVLVEIVPRKINGEEPPAAVTELMKQMDVVLCPTSKSLTHTNARRAAKELGVRVATLPGINEETFVRCMNADYNRIAELTNRLCELLDESSVIRVTGPSGTEVSLPKKGRKAIASHGLFRARGEGGNLPTGEAYLAPLEGQTNGVVVADGSFAGIGKLSEPIRIEVKDGFATSISGGEQARELERLLAVNAPLSRNVAEFGIGTNERAIVTGAILEDEKILGTIHIAFGDNVTMGGTVNVRSHLDGIVLKPTVKFDDRLIMRDGILLI